MIATAIDAILILVVVEAIGLVLLFRRTGQGIAPGKLIGTLAAGFFLMLALRVALHGGQDALVAACLLASLVAHLGDLASRWRGR